MTNKEIWRDQGVRRFVKIYKGSVAGMLDAYRKWKDQEVTIGETEIWDSNSTRTK